ncbi:MAG: response regulator transcription factor [Spirochaetales bacterium]|nr:MAG: response regulator transcription factor [Spirochaetales bacterium]
MSGRAVALAIVEDEKNVREGLKYFLGLDSRIRITGAFGTAEGLVSYLEGGGSVDMVLMDIHLPGMDGIAATRVLQDRWPNVTVLILTIFEDQDAILDSIKAGAKGYILKNTKPDALLEQILSAAYEGSPISPTVARRILDEIRRGARVSKAADYSLTLRETEVLRDIVNGLTYRELAEHHHIAGSTAKKHILHIYQKLNVNSKAEVVRKALEEGLV